MLPVKTLLRINITGFQGAVIAAFNFCAAQSAGF
jgi:hypothetical protein